MKVFGHIGLSYALAAAAFIVLVTRIGFPYHRLIAITVYAVSWVPFALSFRSRRAWIREQRTMARAVLRPYVSHLVLAALLAAFAYTAWVLVPVEATPLTAMTDSELESTLARDEASVAEIASALQAVVRAMRWMSPAFVADRNVTGEERGELKAAWAELIRLHAGLDEVVRRYKGFYQLDYLTRPELHVRAFLAAYDAFSLQYAIGLRVADIVGSNTYLESILNEEDATYGIPAKPYFALKQRLTHPDTLIRLNAGRAYMLLLSKDLDAHAEVEARLQARLRRIDIDLGRQPDLFVDNPLDLLEQSAFTAWFPVQKEVARQMSFLRGTRRDYFITPEVLDGVRHKIRPGDILVERRSWHVTNAGIPGFWPHAAIYCGTLEELDTSFGDLTLPDGLSPSAFIETRYPEVHAAFAAGREAGLAYNVIEAKRPGVILTTLDDSAHADYLGVMRPNLDARTRFDSLCRAFSFFGRPYDFNFDFATDGALVCSELVYKAYAVPAGLRLQTVTFNGRPLLPPNHLVTAFDEGYDAPNRQLEFVVFLDGSEDTGQVAEAGVDAFRASWARPKWEVLH